MKFLETATKLKTFFDLFKTDKNLPADPEKSKQRKRIVLLAGLVVTGILLIVGLALLLRYLKKRRTEKETAKAVEEYYSTDYDADEYDYDEE